MAPAEGRKKLADVTLESYAGWAAIAEKYGTDVTALAECVGLYFGAMGDRGPTAALERVLIQARQLTEDRKRRPR